MLFDLRGRRRRAVQATYLTLAVLMGGGLVLFGIGGGTSGGIVDAITGNGSGGSTDSSLDKRIESQKKKLQTAPDNPATLAELVRLEYQAAASNVPSGTTTIPEDGQDNLRAAGAYWDRYVEAVKGEPDASLARIALIVFDKPGLNQPAKAKDAVRIIAADANDAQSYLLLVQYATAAGDKRTAQLAAQKAVDLAPKNQRKQVEKAAKQLQTAAPQQQ
jgi:hypothetical protein